MPEAGAVERIWYAMDAWLHKGLPEDFQQLRTDLFHILDCIPPAQGPQMIKIPNHINFRTTPGQFGHPASYRASCTRCGWDTDSRNNHYWQTDMLQHNCAPDVHWNEYRDETYTKHSYISGVRIPGHLRLNYLGNNVWTLDCDHCEFFHSELHAGSGDLGAAISQGLFTQPLAHDCRKGDR